MLKLYASSKTVFVLLAMIAAWAAGTLAQDHVDKGAPGFDPQQKKHIENLIMQLEKWPLLPAKKAAEALVVRGAVTIPFLLATLKNGKPQFREAAAYCLARLRAKEAFPVLCEAAYDRNMRTRLSAIFKAMAIIDQEKAYPQILKFFYSSNQTGHSPAYRTLAAITHRSHLPLLTAAFKKAKSYRARKYLIMLIGAIDAPQVLDILIAALSDPSAYVALQAAIILGKSDNQAVTTRLGNMVHDNDGRLRSYAVLACIFQEDRFKKKLLQAGWIPVLLKSVRSNDYFIRGAAAAALVNVGFATDNQEIIELMDKYLAPILIEVLSGKVYFKDYIALRPTAYAKLRQLTGQDLGYQMSTWWLWWHKHSVQFRAIRLLKGISLEDAKKMELEYRQQGGLNHHHLLLLAAPPDREPQKQTGRRVIILSWPQTSRLLDLLKKIKFLDLANEYGAKQPAVWHKCQLSISSRHKQVTVYGNSSGPMAPLLAYIFELATSNSWQLYRDSSRYPNWGEWYQIQQQWFTRRHDSSLRDKRLKEMILGAYGWLDSLEREKAAAHFYRLMQRDNWLPKNYIQWALFHIRAEADLGSGNEKLVQALALSKNSFAIRRIVEFLLQNYSARARKLLRQLLAHAEKSLLVEYLRHPNAQLRAIAAEILGTGPAQDLIILYLLGMLKDQASVVRQAAVTALGNLKTTRAWKQILQMAQQRTENTMVRQSALLALARIDQQKAAPVLLEMLRRNDVAIRSAVAQALGEIGGATAIQTLGAMLSGDPDKMIRQIASNSLQKIGNKQVKQLLLRLAGDDGNPQAQVLAIQTLRRLGTAEIPKLLNELLGNRKGQVRLQAAFALAEFYDKRAVPVLISAIGNVRETYIIRKRLEQLTLTAYPDQSDLAIKRHYQDWWRLHQDQPYRQWLFDALRVREYDVTSLLDYLLGGKTNAAAISLFLQAINDKDWFIRAAACHALERFTGKSFGTIHYYTGPKTTAEIAGKWQEWHRQQSYSDKHKRNS